MTAMTWRTFSKTAERDLAGEREYMGAQRRAMIRLSWGRPPPSALLSGEPLCTLSNRAMPSINERLAPSALECTY